MWRSYPASDHPILKPSAILAMTPNLPLIDYESDIRPDIYRKIKDRATTSVNDILHMSEQDLSKKYGLSSNEVQNLRKTCASIVYPIETGVTRASHYYLLQQGIYNQDIDSVEEHQSMPYLRKVHVTTGDGGLDTVFGGKGLPVGYLIEVFGAAATGKTTLALQLCATVQLSEEQGGLGKGAIWVATEQQFPSTRLYHIVSTLQQKYNSLNGFDPGNFVAILPLKDLETQDHILIYHLSQIVETFQAGLVVIDSIASNFRADESAGKDALVRAKSLYEVGASLKKLAKEKGIVVLCLNQVTSVVDSKNQSTLSGYSKTQDDGVAEGWQFTPGGKREYMLPFAAAHPEPGHSGNIMPALGFTWSNIVNMRIQLSRGTDDFIIIDDNDNAPAESLVRTLKVHFAPHLGPSKVHFFITQGGISTS
ncbi:hypothetical protein SeLEV6574_g08256 [Synchytrium endobioticum]|uniref:RecA family profile 1 domain-containing protein n=1 Tax=Synchytrium endobioticum TaxID=286115 RepID=A0A507C109_9FUNG|nr:hypothetical protein SeLEV6574_g08256 [Synchytrium endobioticum]